MAQGQPHDLTSEAAAATTPADLGLLLRRLLRREGRERGDTAWTYRELAAKTGWSLGSIARYLNGEVVPPTDRFDALVRVLGATAAEQGALATARDRVEEQRRTGTTQPGPRQLPRAATWFTGRDAELASLERGADGATLVITAIDGMAGIGKTALAVQAAHRLAPRYPDGQLFIDLHGFTAGMARIEPGDALDRLLREIGVPGERIPSGLEDRAALWRSVLARRRILIVLDNAATEAQVQPLLPGAAGCLVLVTSRRRLQALEATHTLSLDTLSEADAVELFVRTADRPELTTGAREVVQLCGRLPLAIRIAAARLKHHRVWTVGDLVTRLATLDDGQRSVHGTLHLSYQYLSADAQRLYRLLGVHPGPDFDSYAAAALTAGELDGVQRLLDGLVDDHLLAEPVPGRYRFHDLVRAHAAGLAADEESRGALDRLLDYYRHTAATAMDVAHPFDRQRRPVVPPAGTPTPDLSDRSRADRWLVAELANLLSSAHYAADHGRAEDAWQLPTILDRHLRIRGHLRDAETLHRQALRITHHLGHQRAEADALNRLGEVQRMLGRHEQAGEHHQRALQIARGAGHRSGEVEALNGLGYFHWSLGRYEQAGEHYGQALQIARAIGHHIGQMDALHGLADLHELHSDYDRVSDHYGQALEVARAIGHRSGEMDPLIGLGHVHLMLGRYEQADDHYGQALQIAQDEGHRIGELFALIGLGQVHLMLARYEQADDHFGRALQIAQDDSHRIGELYALNGLGDVHRMLDRFEQAADCYQQMLDLASERRIGGLQFEALQGLGRLHHARGHPDLSLTYHRQALQLATDPAQPANQARAHDGLAHAHLALGQPDQARRHWRRTLDILGSLGNDHTGEVEVTIPNIRAHLSALDRDGPRDLEG